MRFFPGYYKMCKVLYAEFEPYIFRHIKQERFFEYPNNYKKILNNFLFISNFDFKSQKRD